MSKIIREILVMVWKVVRTYLWKWLRPRLARLVFFVVVAFVVVGFLTVLVASSC